MSMRTGRNIARARAAAKLTKSQLASRLGVTRGAVTQWERGVRHGTAKRRKAVVPTDAHLRKIARITKTSLAQLVGGAA